MRKKKDDATRNKIKKKANGMTGRSTMFYSKQKQNSIHYNYSDYGHWLKRQKNKGVVDKKLENTSK